MLHKHDFETVAHPRLTSQGTEIGIRGAEIRKCRDCQKEIVFLMTKKGWFPLFEEIQPRREDILLA